MRHSILIFLFFLAVSCAAQDSFVENNTSETDSLEWVNEIAPMSDLIDLIRFIDSSQLRSRFLDEIPAGYPLASDIDVSSHYGMRKHPVHKTQKFHKGIDLRARLGDAVLSTAKGVVKSIGYDQNLGKFIIIEHPNGFETIYGHLQTILVRRGNIIDDNQKIAKTGATGTVTGPHLHYTLKKNGVVLDPFEFIFMK